MVYDLLSENPTPQHLEAIAQQTLDALQQREHFFRALFSDRNELNREIQTCVEMVCAFDPRSLTEEEIATLVLKLRTLTEALERNFAHQSGKDVAQCYFLTDAIRRMKEARRWIVQGLPPSPASDRRTHSVKKRRTDSLFNYCTTSLKQSPFETGVVN